MKKVLLTLFVLQKFLFAGTINVALAANVSYAIDELKATFLKQYPNIDVAITIGGSGKLTAQIKNGAPYDIFMSANMYYPASLFKTGDAITKPCVYAQGSLALLSVKDQDISKGLDILTQESIRRIAIANPKTAPYGKASIEALKNAKLYTKVKNKFIYGESISQTVLYTMTAADIGFIAKSSLFSPKMRHFKKGINWIAIDTKLYKPIDQGIVLLKRATGKSDAKRFYDFILSKQAKKIFQKYGYSIK